MLIHQCQQDQQEAVKSYGIKCLLNLNVMNMLLSS